MKVLVLAACSLVMSSFVQFSAFAQTSGVGRSSTALRGQDNWSWAKERMSVGGFISSASNFTLDGASINSGNRNLKGAGDMSTGTALGVEAQLIEYKNPNWGYFVGASIEQMREISSMKLNLSNNRKMNGSFANKPKFRPLIVSGGAVYKLNPQVYFSAGLNYTLYKDFGGGDFDSASMDSKPGIQFAAAFKPAPRLALELSYKDVRYSFGGRLGGNSVSVDDMDLAGIAVTGRYSIE